MNTTYVDGTQESCAVRFPAFFRNTQGQMTAVVIKSDAEDVFWCINAWGTAKAADLAEKTANAAYNLLLLASQKRDV